MSGLEAIHGIFARPDTPIQEREVMTLEEARFIASEWHGGQWSPLYALSSTGTVTPGLWGEVNSCIKMLAESGQYSDEEQDEERERLTELLAWVEANETEDGE